MAKKMEQAEPKKECPSCGLGVALDATICEFCGWDFEEEDEWILQIEKLERDLMLEKQKFEPGTVEQKIESTLRRPVLERIETSQSSSRIVPEFKPEPMPPRVETTPPARESKRPEPAYSSLPARYVEPTPVDQLKVPSRFEEPEQETEPPAARRVRTVKQKPEVEVGPVKQGTLVRKVKQRSEATEGANPVEEPQKKTRALKKSRR
jgi:hypothetical protein